MSDVVAGDSLAVAPDELIDIVVDATRRSRKARTKPKLPLWSHLRATV